MVYTKWLCLVVASSLNASAAPGAHVAQRSMSFLKVQAIAFRWRRGNEQKTRASSLKYKNISSPMPNEVLFYIFAIFFFYFVCIMALRYNVRGLRGTQGELFVCVCKWESFARSGWAQVKWIRNYNNIENNNNSSGNGNAIGSTNRTNNMNMEIKTSSKMYDAICWHCGHVMQCKV